MKEHGFDLTVTHRDPKTGAVVRTDPYVMTVMQSDSGRIRVFERPPGSGNLYDKRGQPCGRWEKDEEGKKVYNAKAEHKVWAPPETQDQKLARQVREYAEENERLKQALAEKEVKSIKAEQSGGSKKA